MGPVKDQLRWQVWAYRLSEGGTHLPGITLHTLYPRITPVLSGILMPLYYRPCGNRSPAGYIGNRSRRRSLAVCASLAFGGGSYRVMILLGACRENTGWDEPEQRGEWEG